MEKKSKTVKMESKSAEQKKLSYEELERIANQLNGQCKNLYNQLQEAQSVIANFNDVGMLLSIIKQGENFNAAFIERCSKKVEKIVTQMLDSADENEKSEK
jgi:hypothetical protein